MKSLKVATVVGTRPELIRLSAVIKKLDSFSAIEHVLIHTGQNYDYELNQVFFEDLGIRQPDYFLDAADETPSKTIGRIIVSIDDVLQKEKPDAFLVLGDTNSCLCTIPAKKRMIPIFHMEAGNRCFDQRVPEEINRKVVDHISDINLTYSDISREYLISEGFPAAQVIKTGSPMAEVLGSIKGKVDRSMVINELSVVPNHYYLVSAHREENIATDDNFFALVESLNRLAETEQLPILMSTHPRTRKRINETKVEFNPLLKLLRPLSFSDYIKLQVNAKAVLSDSGTISEESSILKFPALNIREAHERPEAMEEGAAMMVGLTFDNIQRGLALLETQTPQTLMTTKDYDVLNVSEKIVRIIISYVPYINRRVWNKKQ